MGSNFCERFCLDGGNGARTKQPSKSDSQTDASKISTRPKYDPANTPTLEPVESIGSNPESRERVRVAARDEWRDNYYRHRNEREWEVTKTTGVVVRDSAACALSGPGCVAIGVAYVGSELSYGNNKTAAAIGVLSIVGAASLVRPVAGNASRVVAMTADDIAAAYKVPMAARAADASMEAVESLRSAGVTEGAVTVVTNIRGEVFVGLSKDAAKQLGQVREISDAIANCFTRKTCGELTALTKALGNKTLESLRGSVSYSRYVDTGNPASACAGSCRQGLQEIGVTDGVLIPNHSH
jgi:hypothetical protein